MRIIAVLSLCLVATSAHALTFMERSFTCPVGGETFKQNVAASGTQFGVHLDLKPFGAIAAPWPLPICPGNGFVMFKETFTEAQKRDLADYVASDEYREMVRRDTPYFRAAMLMRRIDENRENIAWALLQATWEAGNSRYPRYAEATLDAFRALPDASADTTQSDDDEDGASPFTHRLLIGELLRRLSRFEEADAQFATLERDTANAKPRIKAIVRYQRELIAARDAGTHQVPDVESEQEGEPSR